MKALLFGLQHVFVMFIPNLMPAIVISQCAGCTPQLSAALMQNAMIIAGIATLIQLFPVFNIGSKLPLFLGVSNVFSAMALVMVTQYGAGTFTGAVIAGGVIQGLLGVFAKYWIKYITPLVSALVFTGIGLVLVPIAIDSFLGESASENYGTVPYLIVGSVTLACCIIFQQMKNKYCKALAFFIGMSVGYIVSACFGMVHFNFDGIRIFSLPQIVPFKPVFNIKAIFLVSCLYMASVSESLADARAVTYSSLGRKMNIREVSGLMTGEGFSSALSGLMGLPPVVSFSQNVSLTLITHAVNRKSLAIGAVVLIAAGFFPYLGAVFTSIPSSVYGGGMVMLVGCVLLTGMRMITKCEFNRRNGIIVSASLALGIGLSNAPHAFDLLPYSFRILFENNSTFIIFITAILFELILPKKTGK